MTTTAERSEPTGRRVALLIILPTVVVAALVVALFAVGAGLSGPDVSASTAADDAAIDTHDVLWRLFLAASIIIVLARVFGALFRSIGQPQVVGEIVAGIALGPSVLGALFPALTDDLFTGEVLPVIEILAQLGLIVFMFLVGLEFDPRVLRGRSSAAAIVSHASLLVPFVLGIAVALVAFPIVGSPEDDFTPFALFLGASMAVTAFPVLARILTERGLHRTPLGATTLVAAAMNDITAWCLLAVVVALASADGLGSAGATIALAAAYIAVMLLVVRPLLGRLEDYHEENGRLGPTVVALLFVGVLLSSLATDRIGIHAIFGAFMFGVILPKRAEFVEELTHKLADFALLFLLPLFFAFSGLRTELGALGSDAELWLLCVLIVVAAIVGKWGGTAVAARAVGTPWREANGLGVLMNCRGLTELVILNIGLDLGVIPPVLFTMLVIMALVTTFMTSPLLATVFPRGEIERMVAAASDTETAAGDDTWEILVHLPNLDRAYELVHTALSLAHDQQQKVRVVLLRTAVLESDLASGTLTTASSTDRAIGNLRPIVEFVRGAGYEAVPVVMQTASVGETITAVAAARRPQLVLMTWRRPLFGSGLLHGPVGYVLRHADSDVAVLIDPHGKGTSPRKGSEIIVPYGGGFHEDIGLELALRLARTHGATVHLLGSAGDATSNQLAAKAADAYERSGVWTTATSTPGDLAEATIAAAASADLVVLGVGDDWAADAESLGDVREGVAERSTTPLLVVRRKAPPTLEQGARGLRRKRTGPASTETDAVPVSTG